MHFTGAPTRVPPEALGLAGGGAGTRGRVDPRGRASRRAGGRSRVRTRLYAQGWALSACDASVYARAGLCPPTHADLCLRVYVCTWQAGT